MEIWKDVVGFEGLYKVSNLGNVITIRKNRQMSKCPDRNGYFVLKLSNKSKSRSTSYHRVVAEAFVPNHNGGTEVNHINGNNQDNRPENLEWVTHSENLCHAWREGLYKNGRKGQPIIGESISTGEQLRFDKVKDVEKYGFQAGNVSSVINGKYSQHKGYYWRKAD